MKKPIDLMSLAFFVFQMTGIVHVSVINHYHINELHLFWDVLYIYIYTPGQKYKTTLKNEEKDIVYNF